jgi:ech hydrogenase subunit D
MSAEIVSVRPQDLVGEAARIKVEGYRLVTISCVAVDAQAIDILYHFDKGLALKHFRVTVAKDSPVPSISAVYAAAFLVENEIQDLFGIAFDGLVVDYRRTLYLEAEVKVTPFCGYAAEQAPQGEQASKPTSVES